MNTPWATSVVSKYHFPVKGARASLNKTKQALFYFFVCFFFRKEKLVLGLGRKNTVCTWNILYQKASQLSIKIHSIMLKGVRSTLAEASVGQNKSIRAMIRMEVNYNTPTMCKSMISEWHLKITSLPCLQDAKEASHCF